jgi:hypothetical protein
VGDALAGHRSLATGNHRVFLQLKLRVTRKQNIARFNDSPLTTKEDAALALWTVTAELEAKGD